MIDDGLIIDHISSGYHEQVIIKNISLTAQPQETTVLMGLSGSGKTTLLLTILGIITPMSGKIFLQNKDITQLPIEARNIGYLPQDYGLFPHMSVQDNVAFGLTVRGISKEQRGRKVAEMLDLVGLTGYEKRKIHELSGGQRQRIGLARALAIDPALLLLDEPLSNVDQVTKYEIATHLKALFTKCTTPIIMVTHNYEDALFLADKLAILIEGEIQQIGPLDEVMHHPKNPFIQRLLHPIVNCKGEC